MTENGVKGTVADDSVEKPPHTVTPEEVKGGNEDVSCGQSLDGMN